MKFQCPVWPPDWEDIPQAINALLVSGDWGRYRSEHQDRLREALSNRFSAEFVRLMGSGSAALETALRAAGVGPGDEVIVAALDYPGNYRTIEVVGAKPVLVDLGNDSLSVDPADLPEAASDQVKAVVVSHLWGQPAAIQEIKAVCGQCGWVLIEDACQVPGMMIEGQPAGSLGHLGILSFGGSKLLTSGNGGAILTSESRFSARINSLLDRPSDSQPLSAFQCAALLPQLELLAACNQKRGRTIAHLLNQVNGDLKSWTWLSGENEPTSAYYKIAWAARDVEHRARIVNRATELGLPIGEGFRAMSSSSNRRCRKPVSLDRSAQLGDTAFVLHHPALLIDETRYGELGDFLIKLETETR